jgi:hypothetical protein
MRGLRRSRQAALLLLRAGRRELRAARRRARSKRRGRSMLAGRAGHGAPGWGGPPGRRRGGGGGGRGGRRRLVLAPPVREPDLMRAAKGNLTPLPVSCMQGSICTPEATHRSCAAGSRHGIPNPLEGVTWTWCAVRLMRAPSARRTSSDGRGLTACTSCHVRIAFKQHSLQPRGDACGMQEIKSMEGSLLYAASRASFWMSVFCARGALLPPSSWCASPLARPSPGAGPGSGSPSAPRKAYSQCPASGAGKHAGPTWSARIQTQGKVGTEYRWSTTRAS